MKGGDRDRGSNDKGKERLVRVSRGPPDDEGVRWSPVELRPRRPGVSVVREGTVRSTAMPGGLKLRESGGSCGGSDEQGQGLNLCKAVGTEQVAAAAMLQVRGWQGFLEMQENEESELLA